MSRGTIIAIVVIVALSVAGVGLYLHFQDGFSITGPQGWEKKTGEMGTEVMYLSPQEGAGDQFRENLNVVVEKLPSAMSLDGYLRAALPNVKKMLTDYDLLEQARTSINGVKAERMVFTHRMGAMEIKALQYYLVKDKRAYIVTCTANPDTYNRYLNDFEQACKTIRLP